MTDFAQEYPITATRKEHFCRACSRRISKGFPVVKAVGVYAGEFYSYYYHTKCREAEIAWNDLAGFRNYYDDWKTFCFDLELDDWPFLMENYPIVALRLRITQHEYDQQMQEREECSRAFWQRLR
jgi:hypothetical protein